MFCNLVIDAIYNKILSRLHKMHMLSFSLAHSTHLTVSHSLFGSLCLCLFPPFFAYLCNTIKNFVKRIMHERATARRAVQGRRGEGVKGSAACLTNGNGLLHGKEEQREGKGAASAYCAWSLHDFASNSFASLIIATHVVNTPFHHPSPFVACTKL